jgi:hypothetical protein
MNLSKHIASATLLVVFGCTSSVPARAESNSKGPNSPIVVGTLKAVDATGNKFEVLQEGNHLRKLHADNNTRIYYVGFPTKACHKPTLGYGVKASCEKNGRLKSINFTPSVSDSQPLGEAKLSMTEAELFAKVDKDDNGGVGYVEFAVSIHHSAKHGPDTFRKVDKDADGELNAKEFRLALNDVDLAP